jgi:hypothetical protein
MFTSRTFSRKVLIFIFIAVLLLVSRVTMPDPVSASDGRINLIPWVNGHGAVAVYCVNQSGGTTSFTGGGIKVLNGSGQQLLFAAEKLILAAQEQADKTGSSALILTQGLYSLYALPNGYFLLISTADNEGKTFLGKWYGCTPVGPAPDGQAAPACVPYPPPTCRTIEEEFDTCLNANGGNPDCDGNPLNNESYCSSRCN